MANQSRLFFLLDKYVLKQHTQEEKNELFSLLSIPDNDLLVKQWLDGAFQRNYDLISMDKVAEDDMLRVILEQSPAEKQVANPPRVRRMWTWYAAASIVVIATGWFLLKNPKVNQSPELVSQPVQTELAPGSAKAVLTLGNGKKLTLDDKAQEALSDLGIHNEKSVIRYGVSGEMELNTVTTPRGGQYQIILSDGTKVWLNAASSITYPTVFNGKSRQVSMTGEAYFEVARDKLRPFFVETTVAGNPEERSDEGSERRTTKIEVLGTHFNVNAYNDEPVTTTTLLEGSIRMNSTVLKPGESYDGGKVTRADILSVMAWKNGYFQLKGASTEVLMRQVSRWYDVDVVFEGPITRRQFAGQLQRSLKLSEALRILEESNIHFRREGNKLIVTNSK